MKRLRIMKAYVVLWLFIYFLVYSNYNAMVTFFFATLTFNLAVLTVLVIGMIVILKASINLVMLAGTFGILAYKKENLSFYLHGIEKIMPANIAHMFHARAEKGVLLFTVEESRAVIDWIDEKFSNQARYVNYFIGTALMIGLLGTFTGLLVSIDQMGKIILSLNGDIDLGEVIRGFSGPLGGMATGFGSSLFGVITAIILGLMGYILNKNQETLIEGVEDWLKGRIVDSTVITTPANDTIQQNETLPEHRSSFMDVFIDNISALAKEMAKVAQTNDRLHSITVASVQQARDEHEINYEMLEKINSNLENLNDTSSKGAVTVEEKLTKLENTLYETKELIAENDFSSDITEIKTELKLITSLTEEMQKINIKNTDTAEQLIINITQEFQKTLLLLQEIKNENSINSESIKEQIIHLDKTLQQTDKKIETLTIQDNEHFLKLRESIKHLINELKNETNLLKSLEKLNKTQLDTTTEQTQEIQKRNMEISSDIKKSIQENIYTIEKLLEENTISTIEKLQKTNESLHILTTEQKKQLQIENDEKELLQKQYELLETLIEKTNKNFQELQKIAQKKTAITTTKKESRGFFSKLFK